jgi:hypothetical protein
MIKNNLNNKDKKIINIIIDEINLNYLIIIIIIEMYNNYT